MINLIKRIEFNNEKFEHLKYVTVTWNKQLNKIISKLNKWLIKFNKLDNTFKINEVKNIYDYSTLVKELSSYVEFANSKYNLIRTNLKLLTKFRKFLVLLPSIYGILKASELISLFYIEISNLNIAKKREFSIELINDHIEKIVNNFKYESQSYLKDDKFFILVFDKFIKTNKSIVNVNLIVTEIMNYAKRSFKIKKITQLEFTRLSLLAFEFTYYIYNITNIYENFANKVY